MHEYNFTATAVPHWMFENYVNDAFIQNQVIMSKHGRYDWYNII